MSIALKIGIRSLVEFSCRAGDLGFDGGPAATAQQGLITHKKIQKRYQDQSIAEYSVKLEKSIAEFDIELSGRIDLLFDKEAPPRVEEIKTIYSHLNRASHDIEPSHWAQVKCYAACYALENNLDEINICVNYVNLFSYEEFRHRQLVQASDLYLFLDQVLNRYVNWLRLVRSQHEAMVISAKKLEFPFSAFRSQQYEFAAQVYRNIQLGNRLMVEAPTGSGKTMSTLFPAVKALGEDLTDQIIFLSAKTSGQNEALKATEFMIENGLNLSYLVIRAKAKSCPCVTDEDEIDMDGKCKRCIGFFDRLDKARDSLAKRRGLNSDTISQVADYYQLCPFELSLQMLPWSDIVICDFNYVFDPLVQLGYFKTDSKRKMLLIDEYHNLVDRARSMYSASLSRAQIKQANQSGNNIDLKRALSSIQNALNKSVRNLSMDEDIGNDIPHLITKAVARFIEKIGIDAFGNKAAPSAVADFSKAVFRFQCISNLYRTHHKTISKKAVSEREIKLICLNAFEYLAEIYPLFQSVCGFSATLSPASYFTRALGLGDDVFSLQLDSSFPVEQLNVCLCSYVDTRYRQRDLYLDQICETIYLCSRSRPGNYLVFFSSYLFMQSVHQRFLQIYPDIGTLLQNRAADDEQRAIYLAQFFERSNCLGFAIMGGIYAEGIDYHGESLIGAIVVGVGLPQANTEQKLIEADFNALNLNGFDYAFRYPGLTRVQQSAGRVIRSDNDRGVIILLDRRFQQSSYRHLLPKHWKTRDCPTLHALELSLTNFWNNQS